MPLDAPFNHTTYRLPDRLPETDDPLIRKDIPANDEGYAHSPPSTVVSLFVQNPPERRTLLIELYRSSDHETTGSKTASNDVELRSITRLDHFAVPVGSLGHNEVTQIAHIVTEMNSNQRLIASDMRAQRLVTIQSYKDAGHMAGRRVQRPEWLFSMTFSASNRLKPACVSAALLEFLNKPVPPTSALH